MTRLVIPWQPITAIAAACLITAVLASVIPAAVTLANAPPIWRPPPNNAGEPMIARDQARRLIGLLHAVPGFEHAELTRPPEPLTGRFWAPTYLPDWTTALIADPAFDLAFTMMILRHPPLTAPPPLRPALTVAGAGLASRAHVRAGWGGTQDGCREVASRSGEPGLAAAVRSSRRRRAPRETHQ